MVPIDNQLLRELDGLGCVSYFRQLLGKGLSEVAITSHLLDAVQCQLVPPVPLMSVWLSFVQSPKTIKTALDQNFSLRTRKFALKGFGRLLRHPQWELSWTEFGGLEGILFLFSQLSVREVALITRIIGHQVKPGKDLKREAAICDLVRALLGVDGVDAMHKNPDHRHLVSHYLEMLPACDSSFVEEMLRQKIHGLPDRPWDLKHFRPHSALIARLTTKSAFESGHLPDRTFEQCLNFCLSNLQQGFPLEPGCSMSMSFALDLLRRLTTEKTPNLPMDKYLDYLFEALMESSWKRKKSISLSRLASIVNLCVSCLSRRPKAKLSTNPDSLLNWVVRCWSLKPDALENALQNLLERLGTEITAANVGSIAKPLLLVVGPDLRYRLLRKIFSNASELFIDIDSSEQLARSGNLWDLDIFTTLPGKDAVALLERLRQVKPELGLSVSGSGAFQTLRTIILAPSTPRATKADTEILYHLLRRGQEGALDMSNKFLTQQKQKAMTSRDQTDRAFYARASLFAAIASGSLALLKDTMIWLRRYIRDPLTVKILYDEATFETKELIDLLAGVPEAPSKRDSPIEIENAVSLADEILKVVYETIYQAVREPSFHGSDWQGPLSLFRAVVATRLDRVKSLQRVLRLSDEQLYDTVWKDTLQMLVGIEKESVEEDTGNLDFDRPSGPLCYGRVGHTSLKNATPASYRFIDRLAQARESIWRNVRPLRNSSVAALPGPWPRGLAIQHLLTSLEVANSAAKGYTPYLTARAKSVIFTPAAQALSEIPKDENTQSAIGEFVEEYDTALKIYVFQEHSPEARELLVEKAWRHALQSFTRLPMTEDEGIRYIHSVFKNVVPGFELPPSSIDIAKLRLYPILYEDEENDGPVEWDPLATKPADVEHKSFSPKAIDCMLPMRSRWNMFDSADVFVSGWSADPIWSLQRFKPGRVLQNQREALILSRLLYLDSKIGGESRLLVDPFPSAEDVRYPSLFLDSDFLLKDNLGDLNLRSFIAHVPVDLVRSLADGAMEQLILTEECIRNGTEEKPSEPGTKILPIDSKSPPGFGSTSMRGIDLGRGRARVQGRGQGSLRKSMIQEGKSKTVPSKSRILELERILYDLVAFLAASDRPQAAADLILRIILDRPDASSWYRKLLGVKYLQCLPSAEVQVFFSDFVNALSERLAEQEAHKDNKEWKGPFVKITTLKHIAQLLNEADFISRSEVVNVLVKLYNQAKHIDVRVSVIESMLGMLTPCKGEADGPVASAIVEGLKTTIPLLGGPSERRPITEKDWLETESNGILPEVMEDHPIATLLVDAVAGRRYAIDLQYRQLIMREVIDPALAASALTNERWVKLFASQQGIDLSLSEAHKILLAYPIKPSLVSSVLMLCPTLTTNYILQRYHDHNLALINLPSDFAALKVKIQADRDLFTSASGKTFMLLYNNSLQQYRDATIYFSLLRSKWEPSLLIANGITMAMVQKMLCDLAPEFLASYDEEPEHFDAFISHLRPSLQLHVDARNDWTINFRPILEGILSSISEARALLTPEANPSVLPDIFAQALWLLPWPTSATDTISPLTDHLRSILSDLTADTAPAYHTHFAELQAQLSQLPSVELAAQIALDLDSRITMRRPSPSPLYKTLLEELQARLFLDVSGSTVDARVLESERCCADLDCGPAGGDAAARVGG